MPGKTVDASVMAALCFGELRASEAATLMRGFDLFAPPLLGYELANIARKKILVQPADAGMISESLQTTLALPIHWTEVDYLATLRLALTHRTTVYDASYVYVSQVTGTPLVTFDERLQKASEAR